MRGRGDITSRRTRGASHWSLIIRDIPMIKNLVVNLSTGKDEDGARDYAISLARELDAHLAAVAFAYEPIPATLIGDAPEEWLDELRQEAEEAANAAIERFNAAVQGSGILAEARALTTTMAGAADLFGRIARRFDLAVVRQAEPDKDGADPLIIEAAVTASPARIALPGDR